MQLWKTPPPYSSKFFPNRTCNLRQYFASIVVAPLILSGCHPKGQAESDLPRIETAPPQPEVRVIENRQTIVMSGAPIRRSPETQSTPQDGEQTQSLLDLVDAVSPVLTASSTENGQLVVKAIGVRADSICRKLLDNAGFKPEADEMLSRRFTAAERRNLEGKLAQWLAENSKQESELRSRLEKARRPGTLIPGTPGKLVYTGNALDVACADTGVEPHVFIEVETGGNPAVAFVRGGRLFVSADGSLKLGKFKLPGDWRTLPEGAESVSVQPDGKVSAASRDGARVELGALRVRRLNKFVQFDDAYVPDAGAAANAADGELLRPGHLEYPAINLGDEHERFAQLRATRKLIDGLALALSHPVTQTPPIPGEPPRNMNDDPIVIHADLVLTEQHLKALNIPVERTPGRTTISTNGDQAGVATALGKVLQVLRLRMSVHEQNFRNAEKIRDADNRINPYRRKLIKIGPQGEAVEEADPAPFPKTYKPGDPNADGEGFVIMPNVNRAVETAEFQAAAAEYKLVRAVLERLSPFQIFPDPITLPQKPEGP